MSIFFSFQFHRKLQSRGDFLRREDVLPPLWRLPRRSPVRPARRPPVLHQVLRERLRQQLRRVRKGHRDRFKGNFLFRTFLIFLAKRGVGVFASAFSDIFLIVWIYFLGRTVILLQSCLWEDLFSNPRQLDLDRTCTSI